MEGAQGRVLEHELQPGPGPGAHRAHRHQQQDVGVRDQAEVLQLPGLGLLLDSHLGQVPQLAHQPRPGALPSLVTDLAHRDHCGIPQRLNMKINPVIMRMFLNKC